MTKLVSPLPQEQLPVLLLQLNAPGTGLVPTLRRFMQCCFQSLAGDQCSGGQCIVQCRRLLRVPEVPEHEHNVPCHGCQLPAGDSAYSCMARTNMLSPAFLHFSSPAAAVGSLKVPHLPQMAMPCAPACNCGRQDADTWSCPGQVLSPNDALTAAGRHGVQQKEQQELHRKAEHAVRVAGCCCDLLGPALVQKPAGSAVHHGAPLFKVACTSPWRFCPASSLGPALPEAQDLPSVLAFGQLQ